MANTTLTHQLIADHSAMILEEEAPFCAGINKNLEDEFTQVKGYKPGQNVDIRVPPNGIVHEGAVFAGGGSAPDNTETKVSLTLLPQKHIALTFTMRERALEITEFRERILRPQMRTLASWVEADMLKRAVALVPNIVGTPGTVPPNTATYAAARAKLNGYLAPMDRRVVYSSDANTALSQGTQTLFHSETQVKRSFEEGYIGRTQGADFYEHQSIPVHTNGTATAFTVNGAGQTGSSLNIGGLTAAQTITKGTIFTFPQPLAVHPLTGQPYAATALQQFVVTADFTAAGTTGTISIYPPIQPSATIQNRTVSVSPTNGASATIVAGGRRNLMWERNAFAAAFVGLPVPSSYEGATSRALPNGFRCRVYTFPDGTNDRESTRLDVMYGICAPRPLHAVNIAE